MNCGTPSDAASIKCSLISDQTEFGLASLRSVIGADFIHTRNFYFCYFNVFIAITPKAREFMNKLYAVLVLVDLVGGRLRVCKPPNGHYSDNCINLNFPGAPHYYHVEISH